MSENKCIKCIFIVGGKYYDIDFVWFEVFKLLVEDEWICICVFEDYMNFDVIMDLDFLVIYMCDVVLLFYV